jgi:hypothetical protein
MRMIKIGCGCVLLVVEEGTDIKQASVRLIDYCGATDDNNLRISDIKLLGGHATAYNLEPGKVKELTTAEVNAYLTQLGELVQDGHRFHEVRQVLQGVLR